MSFQATYTHTNLIAADWKRLADFYIQVFGCRPVPPERHLDAPWLAAATGIPQARLDGIHLRLPGWGDNGPTLEIFQYTTLETRLSTAANRPGFGHLAFSVDNVQQARADVLAAGGKALGELVQVEIAGAGSIAFVYVTDPEGNILELQKWTR